MTERAEVKSGGLAPAELRQLVGYYETACGAIGFCVVAWFLISSARVLKEVSWWVALLAFISLALAGQLVVARKRSGIVASFVLQGLQVVGWVAAGTAWKLRGGLYCSLMFTEGSSRLRAMAGYDFTATVGWSLRGLPFSLDINFLPIAVICLLIWSLRADRTRVEAPISLTELN